MLSTFSQSHMLLALSLIAAPLAWALPSMTYVGCFSSSNGLTENNTYTYQSSGYCQEQCVNNDNQAVLGLSNANQCWCGSATPPTGAKVDDSKCNRPCSGYGTDECGGNGFWSVYLTGTEDNVGAAGSSSSASITSAPSKTTDTPFVITSVAPGKTVVITQAAASAVETSASSPASSVIPKDKSSGHNVAGIAAGVVVGVVLLFALIGGAVFFVRRRRRQQAEASHFNRTSDRGIGGLEKKEIDPSGNHDDRVDKWGLAVRRASNGSIEDTSDYSRVRGTLTVVNPDNA